MSAMRPPLSRALAVSMSLARRPLESQQTDHRGLRHSMRPEQIPCRGTGRSQICGALKLRGVVCLDPSEPASLLASLDDLVWFGLVWLLQ